MASRIAVLILPLMIGACSHSVDFTKLDLCRRVLPALHPDQTVLREIRFVGAGEGGIRIDYQAREPGRDARTHQTTCRFEKNDLAAVEIDHRPLGDARFLFLKRFWLAPLGGGHDLEVAGPPVPEWPDAVAYAVQQLASGMVLAAIYGLLATAFSLVYGLAGRINLAFGEIATLGAYGAVGGAALAPAFGWHSPVAGLSVALVVATWLACLWNWLIWRAVIVPLHARHRLGQPILIATAAAA
ncbi:MAG: branched-chain amino acid ABC transporter permease, partial [Pseudorhodoplanes sp.]